MSRLGHLYDTGCDGRAGGRAAKGLSPADEERSVRFHLDRHADPAFHLDADGRHRSTGLSATHDAPLRRVVARRTEQAAAEARRPPFATHVQPEVDESENDDGTEERADDDEVDGHRR